MDELLKSETGMQMLLLGLPRDVVPDMQSLQKLLQDPEFRYKLVHDLNTHLDGKM